MQPSSGPRVAAVETAVVTLRANPALAVRGARRVHDTSSFALVRVTTDDGAEGFGEISATPYWSGEDDVTATHYVRDVLRPALVGQPLDPVALGARMNLAVAGNWFTKAGVEVALWDALGRAAGKPVAELLGGVRRREVPVKITISGDGLELEASYEAAAAAGFRSFKVKVGKDVEGDVARVELARSLVGEAFLGMDANGGWDAGRARAVIAAAAGQDVAFAEQPVPADALEDLRDLRGTLPVVADESVYTLRDLRRVISAGAADAVSLYVGKSGGLAGVVEAARVAGDAGLGVIVGSNGEMGLGAAAQIHAACAMPALGPFPSDIIGHHFYEEDVLESPAPIDGRTARLPDGPGLGVRPAAEIRGRFA